MFVAHCYTAVSVAMTASQYMCGELSSTCETMVQLFAPEEGIDCDVIVTLAPTNGSKAGKHFWVADSLATKDDKP